MTPTLKLRDTQHFNFFVDVKVWFYIKKNCLVLRMQFTSNVDGTPTLKSPFKVGGSSIIEVNTYVGPNSFFI